MKKLFFTLLLSAPLFILAQNDTVIVNNNYKWKIGVKGLFERTESHSGFDNKLMTNYGLQGIIKFGESKSSIESGLYYYSRNIYGLYRDSLNKFYTTIYFNNIHVPIKYRLDTKIVYFTIGVYGEYLLNVEDDFNIINYEVRKFNVGYTASIGFEKNVSTQFSLFFEGTFSTSISSIDQNSSFLYSQSSYNFQLSNSGVAIGITYKILKN